MSRAARFFRPVKVSAKVSWAIFFCKAEWALSSLPNAVSRSPSKGAKASSATYRNRSAFGIDPSPIRLCGLCLAVGVRWVGALIDSTTNLLLVGCVPAAVIRKAGARLSEHSQLLQHGTCQHTDEQTLCKSLICKQILHSAGLGFVPLCRSLHSALYGRADFYTGLRRSPNLFVAAYAKRCDDGAI